MTQAKHQDAERLARARQGLPADVHDPALEEAFARHQRSAKAKPKAKPQQPKPTKKGGDSAS